MWLSFRLVWLSTSGDSEGWDLEVLPTVTIRYRTGIVRIQFRWLCWGFGFDVVDGRAVDE
jgi:hypothetical protein